MERLIMFRSRKAIALFVLLLMSALVLVAAGLRWKHSVASTAKLIAEVQSTHHQFGGWNVVFVDPPAPSPLPPQALLVVRSEGWLRQHCPEDEFFPGDRCVALNWSGMNWRSKASPLLQDLLHNPDVQETLKHLDIEGRLVSDGDARSIMQMHALESLDVLFTGVDPVHLSEATFAKSIKRLHVGGARIEVGNGRKPAIPLRHLREWPLLEQLNIFSAECPCEDEGDANSARENGWTSLRRLSIGEVENTLCVLREHFGAADLRIAHLYDVRVDEPLVDFLRTKSNLQELTLRFDEYDDSAMRKLASIEELRKLDVVSQRLSPATINEILKSPTIRELRCNVTEGQESDVVWDPSIQSVKFFPGWFLAP